MDEQRQAYIDELERGFEARAALEEPVGLAGWIILFFMLLVLTVWLIVLSLGLMKLGELL